MFAACLLLACAITGGTLLTFLFEYGSPRAVRICQGACVGLPILAGIGYLFSLWIGLSAASLAISAFLTLLPLLLLFNVGYRTRVVGQFRGPRTGPFWNIGYIVFYLAIAILLALVFGRVVFERPDGMFSGVLNNLGDLTLHMQVINSFVQGHNIPPEDPTYSGVRFAYPFMVDFLAAMLMRAGAGIVAAMWLQ